MKMIDLAYLRNRLFQGHFEKEEKEILAKIKRDIAKLKSPFEEVALNALDNCEQELRQGNFKLAAYEVNLIHNFTFEDPLSWDSNCFYTIEFLSYAENVPNADKIKRLICLLAKLQEKIDNYQMDV